MTKISIILIILGFLYVVYGLTRTYQMNVWQNNVGETLPNSFTIELPLVRSADNYFCVRGCINENYYADFIIDTQANSLIKMETVNEMESYFWGNFPALVRNAYGQKGKYPLYYFESFTIQSLSFNKPLFTGISKSNAIYDLLDTGVIGKNIIKQLFWKFSLDDEKMILFSNKDSSLLGKETENYVKIENGLFKSSLYFPDISTHDDFLVDLGCADAIMVNKQIFTALAELYSPKKYVFFRQTTKKNDTIYFFDQIDFEWNNIQISNCRITYSPITNRNLIGVEVMNRFNFVLAYNEKKRDRIANNLYIRPRNNFQDFKSDPYCSDFGFFIGKFGDHFIIRGIEIGGLADKAGIGIKDKITGIDHSNFDLHDYKQLDLYLKDKESVILEIEKDGRRIDIKLSKDAHPLTLLPEKVLRID